MTSWSLRPVTSEMADVDGSDGAPHDLRVEHLDRAIGIDAAPTRVSWKLPAPATVQHAYRIRAGAWDSGRVDSADSVLVATGVQPTSRQVVSWQVKVWTDR